MDMESVTDSDKPCPPSFDRSIDDFFSDKNRKLSPKWTFNVEKTGNAIGMQSVATQYNSKHQWSSNNGTLVLLFAADSNAIPK